MIDGLHLVIVGKDVKDMYRSWEGLPHPPSLSGSAKFHWTAMVNERGRPLASIGNSFLDRYYPIQVLGLVHADCSFGPGSLEAFYECAMAANVCGIAGEIRGRETAGVATQRRKPGMWWQASGRGRSRRSIPAPSSFDGTWGSGLMRLPLTASIAMWKIYACKLMPKEFRS